MASRGISELILIPQAWSSAVAWRHVFGAGGLFLFWEAPRKPNWKTLLSMLSRLWCWTGDWLHLGCQSQSKALLVPGPVHMQRGDFFLRHLKVFEKFLIHVSLLVGKSFRITLIH